jgi:hypothetical protein
MMSPSGRGVTKSFILEEGKLSFKCKTDRQQEKKYRLSSNPTVRRGFSSQMGFSEANRSYF